MRLALLALSTVLSASAVFAHSGSDCDLTLDIRPAREVTLRVGLKASDALDLFGVDLAAAGALSALDKRATRDAGLWFKLRDEEGQCHPFTPKLSADAGGVVIEQGFACPAPHTALRLDWGLSSISSRDLSAHAVVRRSGAEVAHASLSRRQTSLDVPADAARAWLFPAALTLLLVVVVVVALRVRASARLS